MSSPSTTKIQQLDVDRQQLQNILLNIKRHESQAQLHAPLTQWKNTFFTQRKTWINLLSDYNQKINVSLAYDDTLLSLNAENMMLFLRPTDTAPARWTSTFTPPITVLPRSSQNEIERTALFIASHEDSHFLYQWQYEHGWKHTRINRNNMFFTKYGTKLTSSENIDPYLDGIQLSEHAIYYPCESSFPYTSSLCLNNKYTSTIECCRLWGNAIACDLQWSALVVHSPQADKSLCIRHFRKWGLSSIFKKKISKFSKPCENFYKTLINGNPHIPEYADEALTAEQILGFLHDFFYDFIKLAQNMNCPIFLDGWFNCALIRSELLKTHPSLFHFGAENIFTPWHRTLCP